MSSAHRLQPGFLSHLPLDSRPRPRQGLKACQVSVIIVAGTYLTRLLCFAFAWPDAVMTACCFVSALRPNFHAFLMLLLLHLGLFATLLGEAQLCDARSIRGFCFELVLCLSFALVGMCR